MKEWVAQIETESNVALEFMDQKVRKASVSFSDNSFLQEEESFL